jgi:hypothetical protein
MFENYVIHQWMETFDPWITHTLMFKILEVEIGLFNLTLTHNQIVKDQNPMRSNNGN